MSEVNPAPPGSQRGVPVAATPDLPRDSDRDDLDRYPFSKRHLPDSVRAETMPAHAPWLATLVSRLISF